METKKNKKKEKEKKKKKRREEERIVRKKLVPYLVHFIATLFVFSKEENLEDALLALAKLIRGVKTHACLTLHVALITRSYNPIDRQFTAVAPVNGKF